MASGIMRAPLDRKLGVKDQRGNMGTLVCEHVFVYAAEVTYGFIVLDPFVKAYGLLVDPVHDCLAVSTGLLPLALAFAFAVGFAPALAFALAFVGILIWASFCHHFSRTSSLLPCGLLYHICGTSLGTAPWYPWGFGHLWSVSEGMTPPWCVPPHVAAVGWPVARGTLFCTARVSRLLSTVMHPHARPPTS